MSTTSRQGRSLAATPTAPASSAGTVADPEARNRAVRAWTNALGAEHVIADDEQLEDRSHGVCGARRRLSAYLSPASTAEVVRAIEIANEFRQPLAPTSTGCNWGLGSRLPVRDGVAILDLRRMRAIREVDTRHGVAVVEPGVTQQQLYTALQRDGLPYVLNITGSASFSGLIGNLADRGIGSIRPRVEEASGMEVVLGTGQVVHSGFGHYPTSKVTHLFPYGVGPSLDGLFVQSAFGVITAAGFALIAEPEEMVLASCVLREGACLAEAVDAYAQLCREGLFFTAARIGNRRRSEVTISPLVHHHCVTRAGMTDAEARAMTEAIVAAEVAPGWSFLAGIAGPRAVTRSACRVLTKRLAPTCTVKLLRLSALPKIKSVLRLLSFLPPVRRKRLYLEAMEPALHLTFGRPTDMVLRSTYWPVRDVPEHGWEDLDRQPIGLRYVLPIIPFDGESVERLAADTEDVFAAHRFEPYITMNEVQSRSLECVINLSFDRDDPDATRRAKACIDAAQQRYLELGFIPYRASIDNMHQLVDESDPYWRVVGDLKRLFDPNGIISPGRYCPI